MLGITFILSIMIIYQASTINKLRNKQASEIFLESKLKRDQYTAKTLQTLKALIDDENISKQSKVTATSKYLSVAIAANNEAQIELLLKNKGYDEVVATITDDRVRIFIRQVKKSSEKQLNEIRDIIISVTKIKDIEVQTKN